MPHLPFVCRALSLALCLSLLACAAACAQVPQPPEVAAKSYICST